MQSGRIEKKNRRLTDAAQLIDKSPWIVVKSAAKQADFKENSVLGAPAMDPSRAEPPLELPLWKKVLFAFLPVVLLAVTAETVTRISPSDGVLLGKYAPACLHHR